MVHKPEHRVHSFRGLLGDGGQDEINLERQNVNLAYRIVKLELFFNQPGADGINLISVWRESQTSIPTGSATFDFTDTDLLAVGEIRQASAVTGQATSLVVTFDNILFSRNIFVTHSDNGGAASCNYYLELEEVPVGAATLMQLKLQVARKLNLSQDPVVT